MNILMEINSDRGELSMIWLVLFQLAKHWMWLPLFLLAKYAIQVLKFMCIILLWFCQALVCTPLWLGGHFGWSARMMFPHVLEF
uniref:Uncharacterized protein n=1 Tax=Setaria italica TaxID=4555 RepID=K3ZPG7_SETIT